MTAPQDLLAHGRMKREDAMPPNRVVLAGAKRAQQAYDLSLPGRPASDLTIAAPEWDSLDAKEQGEVVDARPRGDGSRVVTGEVLNPVDIEQAIRGIANRIAAGVKVCSDRYETFLTADRDYDRAFAGAYLAHDGAAHERKYAAELATHKQRETRDVADAAYRYADRQHRALQDELRAYQSVGASIRQMYAVAGRGEGA